MFYALLALRNNQIQAVCLRRRIIVPMSLAWLIPNAQRASTLRQSVPPPPSRSARSVQLDFSKPLYLRVVSRPTPALPVVKFNVHQANTLRQQPSLRLSVRRARRDFSKPLHPSAAPRVTPAPPTPSVHRENSPKLVDRPPRSPSAFRARLDSSKRSHQTTVHASKLN